MSEFIYVLGVPNFANYEASASLIRVPRRGGQIDYFSIGEDRLTRTKHTYAFPLRGIQYCLEAFGLEALEQIDFIYTDYAVPVEAVRNELHTILQRSGMWDGRTWGLQVTNASDRSVELRALMSAPNGPKAFDLRCFVREKLIEFLQREYPQSLPCVRNFEVTPMGDRLSSSTPRPGPSTRSCTTSR